jgi:hypothetical protein
MILRKLRSVSSAAAAPVEGRDFHRGGADVYPEQVRHGDRLSRTVAAHPSRPGSCDLGPPVTSLPRAVNAPTRLDVASG